MKIVVLFFAAAREKAGTDRRVLDVADGSTVGDLWARLAAETPALAPVLATSRAAVDEAFAPKTLHLRDGSVVAVLPPVSGG